jgi:hypothetical protein
MTYGSERRRHLRAEIEWPISIRQNDLFVDGVTKNIGHNGALICSDHQLTPGERARIAFKLPDRLPLVVDAEVTRANIPSSDCGLFETGVRFVAISPEDSKLIDVAVSDQLTFECVDWYTWQPQNCDTIVFFDERRRYPRAEVHWTATMTTSTGSMEVTAHNLSFEGAFVRCAEVPDLEDVFRLMVKSPQGRSILATGRKVWSDICFSDDIIFCGIGVSFLYIVDDDRHALAEMISELFQPG